MLVKIDERKDLIREKNSQISKISSDCDKLEKEKNTIELRIKEINHKKTNLNEQLNQSNHQVIIQSKSFGFKILILRLTIRSRIFSNRTNGSKKKKACSLKRTQCTILANTT